MKIVDICMLRIVIKNVFQKYYDNMSFSDLLFWLGLTKKLSNFDFVQ